MTFKTLSGTICTCVPYQSPRGPQGKLHIKIYEKNVRVFSFDKFLQKIRSLEKELLMSIIVKFELSSVG